MCQQIHRTKGQMFAAQITWEKEELVVWLLGNKGTREAGCTAGVSLGICSPKSTPGAYCGTVASGGTLSFSKEAGKSCRQTDGCLLGSGKLRCFCGVPAGPLLLLGVANPYSWQSLPCAAPVSTLIIILGFPFLILPLCTVWVLISSKFCYLLILSHAS